MTILPNLVHPKPNLLLCLLIKFAKTSCLQIDCYAVLTNFSSHTNFLSFMVSAAHVRDDIVHECVAMMINSAAIIYISVIPVIKVFKALRLIA